jgi:hypothetical protein
MMGALPTNKRIKWSEIHIYRIREGKIVEHWAEIAMMELLCVSRMRAGARRATTSHPATRRGAN